MRISVVIPCHDVAPYLAQTLGSVLDQERPPDEILVLDDGSNDGSAEIAARFQAAAPRRVRVFTAACGRASRVRNLGALAAGGDALMFLDADDVLRPDALAGLEATLRTRPEGVAACPWFRLERTDGRWIERPPSCVPRLEGEDPLSAWLRGWYYPPGAVLWSREAFEAAGRWDEQAIVNQDGDLMMRALALGVPLVEGSAGAAYYRRRPADEASVSAARVTPAGLGSRLRTIEKIAALLEQDGRIDRYRAALQEALERVAADARGRHAESERQARELAARYGPPALNRVATHLRRRWTRSVPVPNAAGSEVRDGLARAERALAAAARSSCIAPVLKLPRRPAVTVILPTYNRAHLLRRAVDSALAQTFDDFELLIVDDGSTDETSAVARSFTDARVRYLRQPRNAGVSAARNRGLREARADLIAFLDSDDEWLPEKLALQAGRLERLPERVGLLYGGVLNDDGAGGQWISLPSSRGRVYHELLLANVIHGTSGVMIRRSVVSTIGFFDERIPAIEDYDYWVRLARFFEIDFIDAPLIRYHDAQLGERKSLDSAANIDARWWFYRKHAAAMRRAGVAHLFLRESVRRALRSRNADRRTARRLALQAVLEAPLSRMTIATFMRTAFPRAAHVRWVQHHAALE
ncbi:MAG TPA: glycosyltransferase family A protein [Vicinamibacterales bacterium]|nr:glycosyltransferase family A protein [Vicinamibacterales bacterium]